MRVRIIKLDDKARACSIAKVRESREPAAVSILVFRFKIADKYAASSQIERGSAELVTYYDAAGKSASEASRLIPVGIR